MSRLPPIEILLAARLSDQDRPIDAVALGRRGSAIVIHYNTSAADAQQAAEEFMSRGIQAMALAADLANEEQVKNLVARTRERFGRIDVLVNCAAAWKSKRLED